MTRESAHLTSTGNKGADVVKVESVVVKVIAVDGAVEVVDNGVGVADVFAAAGIVDDVDVANIDEVDVVVDSVVVVVVVVSFSSSSSTRISCKTVRLSDKTESLRMTTTSRTRSLLLYAVF